MDTAEFFNKFHLTDRLKNKEEVRVKFLIGSSIAWGTQHLNPSFWMLKSWYRRNGKHNNKITWLDAIHDNNNLTFPVIKKCIEDEKPDVICVGLYLWNHDLYKRICIYIKENWPEIIIIAGGPQIYAHRDPAFWQEHPWPDALIYGEGERTFAMLLDSMIDSTSIAAGPVKNICFRSDDGPVVCEHERFKDPTFDVISPYLDNKQEICDTVAKIRALLPEAEVSVNWEFTKGCPYRCSFCDWSSGLHHKVTRKKYEWRHDLDLFNELNLSIRWVDANVGMFKDDGDIITYGQTLEQSNPKFVFTFYNLVKLNKKFVYDMLSQQETIRPGKKVAISLQDIHEEVLTNIDRPEIPWKEHKEMILETKRKHPSFNFHMELIVGLPGQTLEGFAESIIEFAEMGATGIQAHLWSLLTNSPAYNKAYRDKHKIEVAPTLFIESLADGINSRDEIEANIDRCQWFLSDMIIGTYSCSLEDIMAMYGMSTLYNSSVNTMGYMDLKILKKVLLNYDYWRKFGQDMGQILRQDLQTRGKLILAFEKDGKPISFNHYFGDKKVNLEIIKAAYKTY